MTQKDWMDTTLRLLAVLASASATANGCTAFLTEAGALRIHSALWFATAVLLFLVTGRVFWTAVRPFERRT